VAATGLRGDLVRPAGHQASGAGPVGDPDARRLARQCLTTLGARPYLQVCDRELATADAPAGPQTAPVWFATGRSRRQAAAELLF
jgi:hypothetical protein